MTALGYVVLLIISSTHSAKILGVFQFPSLSHQVVFQPLWKELSLRGHEVTVVTPYPIQDKSLINLTEIDASSLRNVLAPSEGVEKVMSKDDPSTDIMKGFYTISEKLQDAILQNAEFKKIFKDPKSNFDLIIVEALHPGMYALAGLFKAPIIGISSLGVVVASHESVGNFIHPVLYPDMNLPVHFDLTLKEKICSFYFHHWLVYYYNFNVIPRADAIARKHLGDDIPDLSSVARNVSLIFVNSNPIIYNVRPNVPAVIELGQMHVKKPQDLPLDLQKILDNAKEGVIYFSLGSNVKSANLPANIKDVIIKSLSSLPYTVLWKWESEHVPGVSKNVITRKWFPQQDVLAHPNIKAFVTQGGLQSIEEAISRGIPMIGMPFIGDQPMNVKKMVKREMAIEVDPSTATVEQLTNAIIEVAENLKYKRKMKEIRDIVNDQPMTGLERAVWWAEYVIRHKGAAHLRSPTADIPLYQYLLLDVIGTVVAILVVAIYLFVKIIKISLHVVRPKVNKQKLS